MNKNERINKKKIEMLLGGETQVDSYNSPTSNGSLTATDENITMNINGNTEANTTSLDTPMSNVNNVNLIQPTVVTTVAQQIQTIADEYKTVSKDSNQNFLSENNLELYQPQHQPHISPRVQPYDLNIAHQQAHLHNLRSSSNHINHYSNNNNTNGSSNHSNGIVNNNGRKLSPYKNQNLILNNQNPMYDGIVSSSSGNDMMILKVEPENGY